MRAPLKPGHLEVVEVMGHGVRLPSLACSFADECVGVYGTVQAMRDSELLWHYTTTAGLIGIATAHELWASSSSFMNDPEEDRFAEKALASALKGLDARGGEARAYFENGLRRRSDTAPFSERFVVCASRHGDALEMWRAYGAGMVNGTFAIGMDPNVPLGPVVAADTNASIDIAGWRDVVYESIGSARERAKRALSERFTELDSKPIAGLLPGTEAEFAERQVAAWDAVADIFSELVSTSKHEAYEAENEVRLSFDHSRSHPEVRYRLRQGPHGPVPYLALTAAPDWGSAVSVPERLPVHKVVTWPGAPRAARQGVAAALSSGGHVLRGSLEAQYARELGHTVIVDIAESEVPFV